MTCEELVAERAEAFGAAMQCRSAVDLALHACETCGNVPTKSNGGPRRALVAARLLAELGEDL
ncbi:MAG: hypothetical protein ACRCV9_09110 [Burkholderiaceae bacterium]